MNPFFYFNYYEFYLKLLKNLYVLGLDSGGKGINPLAILN